VIRPNHRAKSSATTITNLKKTHSRLITLSILLAALTSTTLCTLASPTITKDLNYLAPGRKEKLDIYHPSSPAPGTLAPAIVIIHGGGWIGGDKAAKREIITGNALAAAGYLCVSIEYWKGSKDRWPTNLQDCKNAVRWLRMNAEKLKIDPTKIGVIGGSAGAHLALMLAYTAGNSEIDPKPLYPNVSDHVSACVNMYGISNLETRQGTDPTGMPNGKLSPTTQLFSESREAAPTKWKLASPVSHIRKSSPPTLTLHGIGDTVVDRAQSQELDRSLKAAGVESTLIMVPDATHAWPLKTPQFDHIPTVVNFFNRHLKP
jgi:acetyl esterase/lipase